MPLEGLREISRRQSMITYTKTKGFKLTDTSTSNPTDMTVTSHGIYYTYKFDIIFLIYDKDLFYYS